MQWIAKEGYISTCLGAASNVHVLNTIFITEYVFRWRVTSKFGVVRQFNINHRGRAGYIYTYINIYIYIYIYI